MRRTVVFTLVAVLTLPLALAAQEPTSERAAWQTFAESLERGASVTIVVKDGARMKGALLQSTAAGILLKPQTRIPVPARTIDYRDIESIERAKQGMRPGFKVLLGTAIGVGTMALISALVFAAGAN